MRSPSLKQYQEIDKIKQRKDLDDTDKALFSVCVLKGLTEKELDNMSVHVVDRMCARIMKQLLKPLRLTHATNIGDYVIDYNPNNLCFGQYVELQFFLNNIPDLHNCHLVLASIAHEKDKKNDSALHRLRADFFLTQPIEVCLGSVKKFMPAFAEFNNEFRSLFGLDETVVGPNARVNAFNKRYGWQFAATRVKEYEGIALDQVYSLSARQALNDLQYLKALDIYREELNRQNNG